MARGGSPSSRARRIIEAGLGVACCPRVEDLREREDYEPLPGATYEPCAVCGHYVSMVPAIAKLRDEGWVPVCTHDLIRFRSVLLRYHTTEEIEQTRSALVQRFAMEHGVSPEDVEQTLPPELRWLEELGVE